MNKDMMNIDDFVRDKLGGHTEKEDPAAWLKMKALLDKEMPEKAAPFLFGWRKPVAFLGAALLIGALCVGGYQLNAIREKSNTTTVTHTPAPQQNNKHNNNKHNTSADHNTATNIPQNNPELLSAPDASSTQNPEATVPLSEKGRADLVVADATTNHAASNHEPLTEAHGLHRRHSTAATAEQSSAAQATGRTRNTTASGIKGKGTAASSAAQQTGTLASSSTVKGTGRNSAGNIKTQHTDAAALAGNTGKTAHNSNNKPVAGQTETGRGSKNTKDNKRSRILNSASGSTMHTKATAAAGKEKADHIAKANTGEKGRELVKNKEAAKPKEATGNNSEELKDSISAITVVTRESTSRGGYPKKITRITDTIAITKIPVTPVNNTIISSVQPSKKEVKMAVAESRKAGKLAAKAPAQQQKNVLASAARVETKEKAVSATVPAQTESVVKVKKEKSAFTQWWENLPEAMADAKRDFKSATFFWGLSGGVNYSSPNGSGGFQGVQFGPTGELVFNKHWSLFGAIKYFNRSGNKKMVSDNFSSQIAEQDSVRGSNWYFTARTDSTNRYFNFSTVHSFEMPITLRYTIRKFYLMTGINLAYYLPVNVEKVEREYNNMNVHVISTNSSKVILNEPTKPQLNIADFGSRFGMGYVIGAGYQITPAWQVDMRIVNPFWDNAKGDGAQKLSKDFYKLPSVQLSFGYQINRIRNRATFGPNSAP